ncbi:MAG TPA: hypothetical protein VFM49_02035 [Chloroflexia bacterium]|nr:hypothetical protein [Chloroflexia bacterium]
MRCPYCGTVNQQYATFCLGCGETLDAPRPADGAPAESHEESTGPGSGPGRAAAQAPARRLRLPRRIEGWIGIVCAVILLVAGTGDAWAQQSRIDSYRTGRAAVAARDWDAAALEFARAGDYRDAAKQQRTAAKQVAERDHLYATGAAAAQKGDWATARNAFEGAARIQPAYADLKTRLAQAQHEAGNRAAAGLVYRAQTGPGAGLYLQGPLDRPVAALPGSDAFSQVLAFSPDGRYIVYDGPGTGRQRTLSLAELGPGDGTVRTHRRLPAGLSPSGWGTFCPGGFWWFSATAPTLSYYDLRTGQAGAVPGPAGSRLLHADSTHGALLFAAPATVDGQPGTAIVRTAADGREPRTILTSPGRVLSAELSPDGNWMLYQREEPGSMTIYGHGGEDADSIGVWWDHQRAGASTTLLMLTWLKPTTQPWPHGPGGTPLPRERMLEHLVVPDEAPQGGAISAHFVPDLPATVVANHMDHSGRTITIYDAPTGIQTTFWPDAAPRPNLAGPYFSPGGGYLLIEEARNGGVRLLTQPLGRTARGAGQSVPVQAPAGSLVLGQVTLRDDYLLYLVTRPMRGGGRDEYSLYSIPLAASVPNREPILLFNATYRYTGLGDPSIALAPSGTLLAYVTPDARLVGVPFDGRAATVLAGNVNQVWSPQP